MTEDDLFRSLLQRVRQGDQAAATDLVRQFEPEIRRAVRIRLTDPRLRRVLDSMDICQSVLANFFRRVTAGEFTLEHPQQLLRLLVSMARNKVLDQARRQQAGRRDQRRIETGLAPALEDLLDDAPGPSRIVAGQDLLEQVRRLLSDEERELAEQRALGRDWNEIGAALGAHPDTLRKKLGRALMRVRAQLHLEENADG